jgi:hypothetical protein
LRAAAIPQQQILGSSGTIVGTHQGPGEKLERFWIIQWVFAPWVQSWQAQGKLALRAPPWAKDMNGER